MGDADDSYNFDEIEGFYTGLEEGYACPTDDKRHGVWNGESMREEPRTAWDAAGSASKRRADVATEGITKAGLFGVLAH